MFPEPASDGPSKYDLYINLISAPPQNRITELPSRPLSKSEVRDFADEFYEDGEIPEIFEIDVLSMSFENVTIRAEMDGRVVDSSKIMTFTFYADNMWFPFEFRRPESPDPVEEPGWWLKEPFEYETREVDFSEEMLMGDMIPL